VQKQKQKQKQKERIEGKEIKQDVRKEQTREKV
jgi:hypothetical protein